MRRLHSKESESTLKRKTKCSLRVRHVAKYKRDIPVYGELIILQ